jgi:uncharacterized protein YkwD
MRTSRATNPKARALRSWRRSTLALLALALPACDDARSPTGPPVPLLASAEAREFAALLDQYRGTLGCRPLAWHDRVAATARGHSADMAARRYFDHVDPDGVKLADRLRRAGISYRLAAETIAAGQTTPKWVFTAWLRSPEHRRILEDCRFTHQGLGREENHWTLVLLLP